MPKFADQVIVITGASGNLGSALAKAFASAGARLALLDISVERLDGVLDDVPGASSHKLLAPVDMTVEGSVKEAVAAIVDGFGRIDVLLNVAGGYRAGTPVHETKLEDWEFMLALNARSVFLACKEVVPHMLRQGQGKIINIGARPGIKGIAGGAAYSASKSAVIRLTESMAAELRSKEINVNCIIPGTMNTPENRNAMPDADHDVWVPLEAVVEAIMFLASDAARAIHGAAVPVLGQT
jgi:NAD(P)-dependent dehydrogenase (short-subunit alcohol dehydrogenase family)